MYVDESFSKQNGKIYKRYLLRTSYREHGKVKHKTIANLSHCTEEEIQAIKLALRHKGDLSQVCSNRVNVSSKQGLSMGAIVLLKALSERLHITEALGYSEMGKQALWQIMARVIDQGSRLSAVRLAAQHGICDLINLDRFTEDDLYKNLDWLSENQEKIESSLFKSRGLLVPSLYLYDVTSSYLEGQENELSDWGYNRDGKNGKKEIVIGLLTDGEGVHERYKDLALVEQGFRTMKTGFLETRPIYVRKEKRTRGHVLVVMLAYMLARELKKLWSDLNVTVEEGIAELSTITRVEIKVGEVLYHQIPHPRALGESLLKLANVTLPEVLPCRNINVATRRKLQSRRNL